MPRVAVVTDSSACIPSSLAEKLRIRVLPITVHLPGSDHPDGGDDLPKRVYQALQDDQPVKSSEPSLADYLGAIEEAEADAVMVVTPATEFTAMRDHATLACELAARHAVTVDSRTAATGQGLVVLEGAEAAAQGAGLDAVLRLVEAAARRVDLVASVTSLGHLRRSGRVPSASLTEPDPGGEQTMFRMRDGAVQPLAAAPSVPAALDAIQSEWARGGGPGATRAGIFHADRPELAAELSARLGSPSFVAAFSAAMGIHTGPGVVGAAWLPGPGRPRPAGAHRS
ncbi:MAG: DegV family protein [Acidimicrobiales bacterium]